MKKYSVFVTIIALAELIYILASGVGASPERYSSSVRASVVSVATAAPSTRQYTAPRATATPKPLVIAKPKATAAPKRTSATPNPNSSFNTYILNTSTKKFHKPSCGSVKQMLDKNKQTYNGPRTSVINMGYSPCGKCNP